MRRQKLLAIALALAWISACAPRSTPNDGGAGTDGGVEDGGGAHDAAGPVDDDAGLDIDAGSDVDGGANDGGPDAGPPPSSLDLTVFMFDGYITFAPVQDNVTNECAGLRPPLPGACQTLTDCPSCTCSLPGLFPDAPCLFDVHAVNTTTSTALPVSNFYGDVALHFDALAYDPATDDLALELATCLGNAGIDVPHRTALAPLVLAATETTDGGTTLTLDQPAGAMTTESFGFGGVRCHADAATTLVLPPQPPQSSTSTGSISSDAPGSYALGAVQVYRVAWPMQGVSFPTSTSPLAWSSPRSNLSVRVTGAFTGFTHLQLDAVTLQDGLFTLSAVPLPSFADSAVFDSVVLTQGEVTDTLTLTRGSTVYTATTPPMRLDDAFVGRAQGARVHREHDDLVFQRGDDVGTATMDVVLDLAVNDALLPLAVDGGVGAE